MFHKVELLICDCDLFCCIILESHKTHTMAYHRLLFHLKLTVFFVLQ